VSYGDDRGDGKVRERGWHDAAVLITRVRSQFTCRRCQALHKLELRGGQISWEIINEE
jgi:hypothetical protein